MFKTLKLAIKMKDTKTNIKQKQKRAYHAPTLKKYGSVKKITLKAGSQADAFGGSYAP